MSESEDLEKFIREHEVAQEKPMQFFRRKEDAEKKLDALIQSEDSGSNGSYYDIELTSWTHERHKQLCLDQKEDTASIHFCCNDIIEELAMDYAGGNAFKAIWRICAAKQGKIKAGNNIRYDAEKLKFFAERVLAKLDRGE